MWYQISNLCWLNASCIIFLVPKKPSFLLCFGDASPNCVQGLLLTLFLEITTVGVLENHKWYWRSKLGQQYERWAPYMNYFSSSVYSTHFKSIAFKSIIQTRDNPVKWVYCAYLINLVFHKKWLAQRLESRQTDFKTLNIPLTRPSTDKDNSNGKNSCHGQCGGNLST